MRRAAALLAVAAAIAAGLVSTAEAGAAKSEKRIFKTRGNVTQISASAQRVAFVQELNRDCDRIVLWQPVRSKATRVPKTIACSGPSSTGQGISDLVLLGNRRVAWIEFTGGNHREMSVLSLKLGRASARPRTHTDFLTHDVDARWGYDGAYVDGLRGHPSSRNKVELLVWNTWNGCFYEPGLIGEQCEPPPELLPSEATVVNWGQRLLKLTGYTATEIAAGEAAMSVVATGDERIAVKSGPLQPGGPNPAPPIAVPASTLTLLDPDGAVLSWFALPAGTYRGAELTNAGFSLVVLRDDRLEVYDTTTGALASSFDATPPRMKSHPYALTSVRKDLATYVSGKRIYVVRLSDGASFSIRPRRAYRALIDASLVTSGLFFSHNVGPARKGEKNGRVVYLSRAAINARLGS